MSPSFQGCVQTGKLRGVCVQSESRNLWPGRVPVFPEGKGGRWPGGEGASGAWPATRRLRARVMTFSPRSCRQTLYFGDHLYAKSLLPVQISIVLLFCLWGLELLLEREKSDKWNIQDL